MPGGVTQGGWSQGITVTEHFAIRMPQTGNLAAMAPLLCAGVTTFSPLHHWNIARGMRVGVVGIGGLGHLAVKLAAAEGADVTMFTTSQGKLADAATLGAKAIETRDVTLGASVTLTPGYRRRDVPEGVDHVSYGAGARIFATARLGGVIANLGGTQGFAGGTRGTTVDASLAYPLAMSERLTLIPALATTWGNAKNNDRYFGIDRLEAINSGLDRFEPGAGFIDASASLTASYRLTDRLSASGSLGVTRLLGDVHRSPLVEHRTQPTGFFSLTYRFGRIL